MAAGDSRLYVVRDRADLARLIATFDLGAAQALVIDISGDDAEEFGERDMRRLFDRARSAGVSLRLVTDDPLLAELARIHGVTLEGVAANMSHTGTLPSVGESADAGERHWRSALTTLRLRLTTFEPSSSDAESRDQPTLSPIGPVLATVPRPVSGGSGPAEAPAPPRYGSLDDDHTYSDDSFAFVITPPTPRRPELAYAPTATPFAPPQRQPRAKAGQRRIALISIAALVGIVLGVAVILLGFLAPYATVTLVPVTGSVSTELTYGIEGSAPNLDVALPPRAVAKTGTYEASLPTTGERFVPDQTAGGAVLFTNPTTSEVYVPAGTVLYDWEGSEYTTSTDLTIPAADPFGSLTFGSASVAVVAGAAGSVGNLAAEELTGQLDSGVYYSNREPIEGGTDRRIAVVSEADKAALEQQAQTELGQLGESELSDQLQLGEQFLASAFTRGEPQLTFEQQVGADAEQLTVRGSIELSGAAYNPEELHAAARDALNAELPGLTPSGEVLVANSVSVADPQAIGNSGSPVFKLSGTAQTRAVVPPEELDAVREDLVGANQDEAAQVVAGLPGVASSEVEVGPDWLPFGRQPRLKSRVTIEVLDEPSQPASTSQQTGP